MGWEAIAADMGISRNAAIERGRRIGARLPPASHDRRRPDPNRAPLSAGDPVSWSLLTAGTSLEDSQYVWQSPLGGWRQGGVAPAAVLPNTAPAATQGELA